MVTLHLNKVNFPKGDTYEEQYGKFLEFFRGVAQINYGTRVNVFDPPWSWVPLLKMLDCNVISARVDQFDQDLLARQMFENVNWDRVDRTGYEIMCGIRPETVDALWKLDNQWGQFTRLSVNVTQRDDFIVTTPSAYYRPEVLNYLAILHANEPSRKKVVLVPCSADKPYPSPVHQVVLDRIPDDWYIMSVTGVLGLVPQTLWKLMPYYDAGIPNHWRVYEELTRYFRAFHHERIVVFLEFYTEVIYEALRDHPTKPEFVVSPSFYADYLDLTDPKYVTRLEELLRQ